MIKAVIYVIECNMNNGQMISFDTCNIGKGISSRYNIVVNKIKDTYTIIIDEISFDTLDIEEFCDLIMSTFMSHLPYEDITLMVQYIFRSPDGKVTNGHKDTIKQLKRINKFLINAVEAGAYDSLGAYINFKGKIFKYNELSEKALNFGNFDESFDFDNENEEDDNDEEDYDYERVISKEPEHISGHGYGFDDISISNTYVERHKKSIFNSDDAIKVIDDYYDDFDNEDEDDDDYYIDNFYSGKRSKILSKKKKTKKDFNRYNMVLVNKKKNIKREYKRFDDNLKNFMGNSRKLKKIRKKIAKRCVDSYAITYEDAHKIEKRIVKKIVSSEKKKKKDDSDVNVFGTIVGPSIKAFIPTLK